MRKRKKRWYTPQLHELNVQRLYHEAKRQGMKMTKLLNLIVAVALEDLEDAPDDMCDVSTVRETQEESREGGIYAGGPVHRAIVKSCVCRAHAAS